jgi:FkbM family methyltransferase
VSKTPTVDIMRGEHHGNGRNRFHRLISLIIIVAVLAFTVKDNVLLSLQQVLISQQQPLQTNIDEPFSLFVSSKKLLFTNQTFQNNQHDHLLMKFRSERSSFSLASVNKISSTHPPLSCWNIFHEDRNQPRPAGDPNGGRLHVRYTNTDPSFWVSLHRKEFDLTRWSIMEYGKYYEAAETDAFVHVVRTYIEKQQQQQRNNNAAPLQPVRVIDVGGNIGWFTLAAVATATELRYPIIVDVFEPNPRNQIRLCESLFFNQWLLHENVSVNLYPTGVTSTIMAEDITKTGRISVASSGKGSLMAMDRENLTGTVTFPLISLDRMAQELDWMNQQHDISLLKVDVEGFELEVLEGAQQLLKSQRIQNIFFEGNLRKRSEHIKFRHMVQVLVSSGYVAYKLIGLRAEIMIITSWTNNSSHISSSSTNMTAIANFNANLLRYTEDLKDECEGPRKKRRQCNLWWRPFSTTINREMTKHGSLSTLT